MSYGTGLDDAPPVPRVVLLGADALLATLPATPVQVAHACMAAGFDAVYPATWGDELIASATLRRLAIRGDEPAILCACPRVADRLLVSGEELERFLIPLVAPVIAAARYLRAVYGQARVHITYIGGCPAGTDPVIDARLTPDELVQLFAEREVDVAAQPAFYDSVLPPDRRRFRSLPGGAPMSEQLAGVGVERRLAELEGEDFLTDLAQRLVSRERVLVDLAPRMGCACAGVSGGVVAGEARAAVMALEPPRAHSEVLDVSVHVDLDLALPRSPAVRPLAPREEEREHPATQPAVSPLAARDVLKIRAREAARRQRQATARARRQSGVPALRDGERGALPRAYAGVRRARAAPVERLDFGADVIVTPIIERERRITAITEPSAPRRRRRVFGGRLAPLPTFAEPAAPTPPPPARQRMIR